MKPSRMPPGNRWRDGGTADGTLGFMAGTPRSIRSGVQLAGEKLPQAALHQLAGTAEAGDRRARKGLAPESAASPASANGQSRLSDSLFNWRS